MAVVYQHTRLDTNEIFYIGIGKTEKRAYNTTNHRNNYWKNIINKTEYKIEILFIDLTWKEACQIEQYLIKYYGRKDLGLGSLINMTDGGEGTCGYTHTKERNEKMSKLCKKRGISKDHLALMIKNRKGGPNFKLMKKVINLKTKKIYDCVSQICEEYKINKSTLRNKLNGFKYNNTDFIYLENYTDDYIKPEKILKEYSNYKKVICLTTLKIWNTTTEASIETGIKRTTLLRSLQNLNKINNYQYYNN